MKTGIALLTALTLTVVGAALAYTTCYVFGYREVHIRGCRTEEPLVLNSWLMPARLDAFIWGYGKRPIKLKVSQGAVVMDTTELQPDEYGALSWSYHGDWYDAFVLEIEGEECRLSVTYRL